jgi:hypothetical protein
MKKKLWAQYYGAGDSNAGRGLREQDDHAAVVNWSTPSFRTRTIKFDCCFCVSRDVSWWVVLVLLTILKSGSWWALFFSQILANHVQNLHQYFS